MADAKTGALTRTVLQIITIVLAVAALLWLLWTLSTLLIVLVLSAFLAYLISPLVDFVCQPFPLAGRLRRVPRPWAILIVYVLIGALAATAIAVAAPRLAAQFAQLSNQLPSYASSGGLQAWTAWFNRLLPVDESIRATLDQLMSRSVESIATTGQVVVVSVLTWVKSLPWLVLIPIFAFFLLKDAEAIRDALISLPSDPQQRRRVATVLGEVNDALAAYIRAQLLASIIIGIVCSVGFMIIGVPYALVLGLLAGIMECIPIVGPAIVALVVTACCLFQSWLIALAALVFLGVLRIVEDYVVYPRLIGSHIDLPPLAVILAVLAGAEVGGVTGVLLAIPVVATAIILVRHMHAGALAVAVATAEVSETIGGNHGSAEAGPAARRQPHPPGGADLGPAAVGGATRGAAND